MVLLHASIKKGGKWYITTEGRLDLVTVSAVSGLILFLGARQDGRP